MPLNYAGFRIRGPRFASGLVATRKGRDDEKEPMTPGEVSFRISLRDGLSDFTIDRQSAHRIYPKLAKFLPK